MSSLHLVVDLDKIALNARMTVEMCEPLGKFDADHEFLFPLDSGMKVLDATSDHLLLHLGDAGKPCLGDRIPFLLGYPALSRLMASPGFNA